MPLVTSLVALAGVRKLTEKHAHRSLVRGFGWSAVVLGLVSFAVAAVRLILGPGAAGWWFWGTIAIVLIALVRLAVDVIIATVIVTKMQRGSESRKITLKTLGKEIATGVGAYVGLAPWL